MKLTSAAFRDGAAIPAKHACDGQDVSPPLSWSGAPAAAAAWALIMDDPDAPPGTWVHWVLYDLPAGSTGLPEGFPKDERPEGGGAHGACWGVDEFSRVGYHGPCPPPGRPHRYVFTLYALDAPTGLPPRRTKADLVRAMEGRVLAKASLTGLYGRKA
ncbi:MAG: YbhB/YbcL family Raf kinase inhibitor-like protein [Elusimicrobia bacterium]|nr:YbhB/YbcL family Raf kinase inhibitor-like protein [Elusimicrobiota bacterium]